MKRLLFLLCLITSLIYAQPSGGSGAHITNEAQHILRHSSDRVITEAYSTNTGITVTQQLNNIADGLVLSSAYGDITSVGDVASGAAFDGTQGTTLTFYNAGGNKTFAFNGSQFDLGDDLDIAGNLALGTGSVSATQLITGVISLAGASAPQGLNLDIDYTGTTAGVTPYGIYC